MSAGSLAASLERVALTLVPARDRDALLGDLAEEGARAAGERIAAIVRVGAAYQREPYRDGRACAGVMALFATGAVLLRVVPLAASGIGFADLDGVVWQGAAAVWAHHILIAAAAVGLIVGRALLIPEYAASARWHVAVALAMAVAVTAATWTEGLFGAALLLATALLAASARDAADAAAPPGAVS